MYNAYYIGFNSIYINRFLAYRLTYYTSSYNGFRLVVAVALANAATPLDRSLISRREFLPLQYIEVVSYVLSFTDLSLFSSRKEYAESNKQIPKVRFIVEVFERLTR